MANLQELEQIRSNLVAKREELWRATDRAVDSQGLFLKRKNAIKALADTMAKCSNKLNRWQEGWDQWDDSERRRREEIRGLEQEIQDAPTDAMGMVLYDNLEERMQAIEERYDQERSKILIVKSDRIEDTIIPEIEEKLNDLKVAIDGTYSLFPEINTLSDQIHNTDINIYLYKTKEKNAE